MRDRINDNLKTAIKAKEKRRVGTLRLINAAIKDRDIAARSSGKDAVTDADIVEIMAKMVKQRKESAVIYEDAGRPELAAQELEEIEIINVFLPQQMDEDETSEAVKSVVSELGAESLKDMGRTMAALKERYPGQMDFRKANSVVKELLS